MNKNQNKWSLLFDQVMLNFFNIMSDCADTLLKKERKKKTNKHKTPKLLKQYENKKKPKEPKKNKQKKTTLFSSEEKNWGIFPISMIKINPFLSLPFLRM